jgi:3-deoxy-manno-octulosonate cytidylyltransferase (CMP-KDO synthetase)
VATSVRAVIAIPARYGSTRLPGKALCDIGGEPMVVRVWRRCTRVRGVERVLVATDDERIRAAVARAGGEAVMTSPAHLSGTDRIAEAVRGTGCDVVVNVQGDEPFLDPAAVESLLAAFAGAAPPEVATIATPLVRPEELADPAAVKVLVGRDGNAVYFSRFPVPVRETLWETGGGAWRLRPDADVAGAGYLKHVGLYAYRPRFLEEFTALEPTPGERAERLEQLRILEHGRRIRVVVTPWASLSVDTPADLERARHLAAAG